MLIQKQQIELVGQLNSVDGINADRTQDISFLTILEKIKQTRLKFFSWKRNSIVKDGKLTRSES